MYLSEHKVQTMRDLTILLVLFLTICSTKLSAQSVRKPWTELTTLERQQYVNAINSLSNADVRGLADEHDDLFGDGIHVSPEFLPWHRIFLIYFEELIQAQNPDITIPYWDWHETWSSSSLLFQHSSGANTGLLGQDVSSSVWEDGGTLFNRGFTNEPQLKVM
jgi:tyrosinase